MTSVGLLVARLDLMSKMEANVSWVVVGGRGVVRLSGRWREKKDEREMSGGEGG